MFTKYKKEYNDKINFKLIYFITPKADEKVGYTRLKAIYERRRVPVNKQEIEFSKLQRSFEHLLEQGLTVKSTYEVSRIMEVDQIDEKRFEQLDKLIESPDSTNELMIYTMIFLTIIKENTFENKSLEVAILVFNALLSRLGYVPIVLSKKYLGYLQRLIYSNVTVQWLYSLFAILEDYSVKYNTDYGLLSKKDLLKKLDKLKDYIISNFEVSKLWIYGSYAKNCATKYSDIDIFVQFRNKKTRQVTNLKLYLEKEFQRHVDIQIEGEYRETFSQEVFDERELIISDSK